jgi:hypothetical protein
VIQQYCSTTIEVFIPPHRIHHFHHTITIAHRTHSDYVGFGFIISISTIPPSNHIISYPIFTHSPSSSFPSLSPSQFIYLLSFPLSLPNMNTHPYLSHFSSQLSTPNPLKLKPKPHVSENSHHNHHPVVKIIIPSFKSYHQFIKSAFEFEFYAPAMQRNRNSNINQSSPSTLTSEKTISISTYQEVPLRISKSLKNNAISVCDLMCNASQQ